MGLCANSKSEPGCVRWYIGSAKDPRIAEIPRDLLSRKGIVATFAPLALTMLNLGSFCCPTISPVRLSRSNWYAPRIDGLQEAGRVSFRLRPFVRQCRAIDCDHEGVTLVDNAFS